MDSSPAIGQDGTIYVGSGDSYLYAIGSDGNLKWKFGTGYWVHSSPAIGQNGVIYVGSGYYLYAINPNGSSKWKFKTEGYIESSPAIGKDGTVYVGSQDNYLYAINPDGTLKWKFKAWDEVNSSPAIGDDGTIYVGSNDGYLYAISPDGSLKWKFWIGDWVDSSPAIGEDGTIYVGSWDNYLYAINSDGSLSWKFKTGDPVYSSPAIGQDGVIYVGSGYYLYAISPSGTLKWKFETEASVLSSPAIGQDGTIYIGSYDHYFYAIHTNSRGLVDSSWPMLGHDIRHTRRVKLSILFSAYSHDFGFVLVGSHVDWVLVIYNVSNAVLTVNRVTSSNLAFTIPLPDFPKNIFPGDSLRVIVRFSPTEYKVYSGFLSISFDKGVSQISLTGGRKPGSLRWKFKTGAPVLSSPAIGNDGTIYVGSWDNYLYALTRGQFG